MAATVSYKINGKYDGKAIGQAQKGMSGLSSAAGSLGKKFLSLGAAVFSFKQIVSVLKDCASVFTENNKVQTQFFYSLQKNTKMAGSDIKSLVKEFDSMAGYFGGDEIVKAGNIFAQLGLDKDQLKAATQTARDMAASGIMSLEQAVQALGKSYSGNSTALGKLFPEIKELTAEELKQGKAVELLGTKYKGFEEQMGKTFEGMDRKYTNKMSALKDTIGGIAKSLIFTAKASLIDRLEDIQKWFEKNQKKIISFFYNLPDIIKSVFEFVKDIINNFKSSDGIEALFTNIGDNIKSLAEFTLETTKDLLGGIVGAITAFIKNLKTGDIGQLFLNLLKYIANTTLGELGKVVDVVMALFDDELSFKDKVTSIIDIVSGKGNGKMTQAMERNNMFLKYNFVDTEEATKAATAEISEAMKGFGEHTLTFVKATNENNKEYLKTFKKDLDAFSAKFKEITGRDLPEELVTAFNYGQKEIEEAMSTGVKDGFTDWAKAQAKKGSQDLWAKYLANGGQAETPAEVREDHQIRDGVLSQLGDLGDMISSLMTSAGWIGILLKLIGSLISDMQNKSQVFADFLGFFATFADKVNNEVIVGFFDDVLVPLMNILSDVGEILGNTLAPVLSFIAPILDAFATVIKVITGAFKALSMYLYNFGADLYNAFHLNNQKKKYSQAEINSAFSWDSITSGSYQVASSQNVTGGTAASYNAARDVYVTINYDHSFVNGDARDIAINLYNELKSAGQLGYVTL